jgi:hypothetical protein
VLPKPAKKENLCSGTQKNFCPYNFNQSYQNYSEKWRLRDVEEGGNNLKKGLPFKLFAYALHAGNSSFLNFSKKFKKLEFP